MKVVLTAINTKYIHSNPAIYSLRAYAEPYRENVILAEYTINQQMDDILMDLYKKKPELLCFSCYIWNRTYVFELAAEIHKIMPQLPIWLGGPEVSYDAETVLRDFPQIMGVMCGEGEETFLELLDYYHGKGKELSEIAGIAYRDLTGDIFQNPWRPVLDLSKVPFIYEDMQGFENKIIYYESSRGCPFSCSYCLSSVDKCLRFRDLELVKKELQFFIDAGVPQVKFVDRTFNCNHKHCVEIWRYLAEHDNGKTNFHFEVSADLLNEEELGLIASMRPGLIQLEIGVQSTHEPTIREIKRTMKFKKLAEVVKRIKKGNNVHQHLDLIAGLPFEDFDTFKQSFDDVYGLRPEQLQLGFLKVLKGSYMEEHKSDYGIVHKEKPPYEVLCTRWLSYEDVLSLKRVEEMVEIYYNSGQFTYTLKQLEKQYESAFCMYQEIGKFYETHNLHMMSHSRVTRYEILLDFVCSLGLEEKLYRELLTLDFYLRENAKNRPGFAGEYKVNKEELFEFYQEEAEHHRYLKGYEKYDRKQLRNMTHMERFSYDIFGECEAADLRVLFDYQNRNPFTHQATAFHV